MANEEKVDRRVRKTKAQLREALNQLITKRSIKEISVKELTATADVNRGTFYLHYKDIYDMVHSIEDEMFNELRDILNSKRDRDSSTLPLSILVNVFKFLAQNHQMCCALLGPNGDVTFSEKLRQLIRDECFKDWMSYYSETNSTTFEYYYSFIVTGCSGLFMKWLEKGMRETPEQMATMAGQMIMYGAKVLY